MTHTPGPWKFDAATGEILYNDGQLPLPQVATVQSDNTQVEQYEADGNLIAAAPDLLAALKEIAAWDTEPNDVEDPDNEHEQGYAAGRRYCARMARAAVAKAEGR